MSIRKTVAAVMVLGALALLAACGGGSGGQKATSTTAPPAGAATTTSAVTPGSTARPRASTGELDACALVTKAEVEAAIGTTVLDAKPETSAGFAGCSFNDPSAPAFTTVTVSVLTSASASVTRGIYDIGKQNANDPQSVPGLGDDAYWDATLGNLDIAAGTYELNVSIAPLDNADRFAAAKAIAARALARLP